MGVWLVKAAGRPQAQYLRIGQREFRENLNGLLSDAEQVVKILEHGLTELDRLQAIVTFFDHHVVMFPTPHEKGTLICCLLKAWRGISRAVLRTSTELYI